MESPALSLFERWFLDEVERRRASGRGINTLICNRLCLRNGVPLEDDPLAEGCTALHFAARQGWPATVTRLLENGADAHTGRPLCLQTPLHAATMYDRHDAAVVLLNAGARVDDRDIHGRTALHIATGTEETKFCQLLLSRGASLDLRCSGLEPETYARFYGKITTAAFLAEVRAAGGWARYVAAPRAELLALRRELPSLRERGRASPSTVRAHERLFLDTTLPDEVFSHILAFWRTPRDY